MMKLNKRRIMKLIEFMEKLPKSAEKHFQMRWWYVHEGDEHEHKVGKFITRKTLEHCGTRACALGWAATVPAFQKAGLRVETREAGHLPSARGRKVFGLDQHQFDALFVPSEFYPRTMNDVTTPKQWAKKARSLLKEWGA